MLDEMTSLCTFPYSLCDTLAYILPWWPCAWYVSLVHKLQKECWARENNTLQKQWTSYLFFSLQSSPFDTVLSISYIHSYIKSLFQKTLTMLSLLTACFSSWRSCCTFWSYMVFRTSCWTIKPSLITCSTLPHRLCDKLAYSNMFSLVCKFGTQAVVGLLRLWKQCSSQTKASLSKQHHFGRALSLVPF